MTQINEETPAGIFLLLYNDFKYNIKYGWSARSTEPITDMMICISELEREATIIYVLDGDFI